MVSKHVPEQSTAASHQGLLNHVSLSNWKSFRSATLHLEELTLLIGSNASGKTNAIEALKLLSWLATAPRISNPTYSSPIGALGVRGTLGDLATRGASSTAIEFTCEISAANQELSELSLRIALETADGELRVIEETLTAPRLTDTKVPLYRVAGFVGDVGNLLKVEYNNFAKGGKKPHVDCVDSQAIFNQLTTPARLTSARSQLTIPVACAVVRDTLGGLLFLDPNPAAMRSYVHRSDHKLRPDGSNVSGVLRHLAADDKSYGRLLEFVSALPDQQVTEIGFVETPRGEVMVKLLETFGGEDRWCDAPLLSDGTLRVLSIAAALLSVPTGTLVVIEEIDNGVHPSRAEGLLKSIRAVASERGLRVLLTTHNPALLDALPVGALPGVTVCFRDPATGESQLVRLKTWSRIRASSLAVRSGSSRREASSTATSRPRRCTWWATDKRKHLRVGALACDQRARPRPVRAQTSTRQKWRRAHRSKPSC